MIIMKLMVFTFKNRDILFKKYFYLIFYWSVEKFDC